MSNDLIAIGDYLIVQRQNFTKLHKLKVNGKLMLGKDKLDLGNVVGKSYFSTFRMVIHSKNSRNDRGYILEPCNHHINSLENVSIAKSGIDNRNIIDDGESQQLNADEIAQLRDDDDDDNNETSSSSSSGNAIVEKLIAHSKTFHEKTEYSQEKYVRRKEKKYLEYIQIRRPSIRLLADMYYKQDPSKIQGVRIDDLSQILSYANIHADARVLLYDSGTSGLVAAAITNALGSGTGHLIHMHPGNVCQKEAFLAMQFPIEQAERCINVCLYSVLRCFYRQQFSDNTSKTNLESTQDQVLASTNKRKHDNVENEPVPEKRQCIPNWQLENEKACRLLSTIDSLIIIAKEHPLNILNELLTFVRAGKPFVVFSLIRESLQTLYIEMKTRTDIISLQLSDTMLRNYQVLENRTHPDVNMTCGGYILTGFKILT